MSYIGNQPTSVAFLTDSFNGTGSQTAFTMSVAPANTASVLVAVSGVLQDPSTYSVSGTTLTFSAAPPSGTGNISARYLGIPASGIATTAYRTQTEFTATAGQTTFTPPSYTVGFIDVYRNGVLLGSADYTATNGTTVVLTNPAAAGDLVETISFLVSSVLNALPLSGGNLSGNLNLTAGNLGFTGTGQRITGDMSNATNANRVAFKTSTTNGNTAIVAFPNGTGNAAQLQLRSYDVDAGGNGNLFQFVVTEAVGVAQISTVAVGTGTALPMTFNTGGSERVRIDTSGNLLFNSGYGSVAAAYGCRAWVNFNGTGTPAIRGSGNVTSITDNGTGDYTINFTNAMPDVNYCLIATNNRNDGVAAAVSPKGTTPFTTTTARIQSSDNDVNTAQDALFMCVAIFR